jgi:glycosyltransferase involved in cell wall biosynthesis
VKIAIMAPLVTAIREPQLGGSQAFLSDLAGGLVDRGHEVHVYAASGSTIPKVTVIDTGADSRVLAGTLYRAAVPADAGSAGAAIPSPSPHGGTGDAGRAAQAAFAAAYARARDGGYDVIHNHAFDAPAIRLATTMPVPVLHTLHLPPDQALITVLDEAARSARPPVVATVSAFQAAAWRRVIRVDGVLPPHVPTAVIPYSTTRGHGAIFAGRLSPEKGVAEAIDIASAAGLSVDVYGDAYDEAYSRDQIAPRQTRPGVTVHQAIPRAVLWTAISKSAVFLNLVHWDEPFGMAAAEAQACGTPVVAFRRGGLTEVIEDGISGFLVPPGDLRAAAEAVERTGSISRAACRRHAELHLDLEQSLDAHERIYRRMKAAHITEGPQWMIHGTG